MLLWNLEWPRKLSIRVPGSRERTGERREETKEIDEGNNSFCTLWASGMSCDVAEFQVFVDRCQDERETRGRIRNPANWRGGRRGGVGSASRTFVLYS